MIRGIMILGLILALLLSQVSSSKFQNIEIVNIQRNVNLASLYPQQISKITIKSNEDQINTFSYLIPLNYDSKVSKLSFLKSEKDRNGLPYVRSNYVYDGVSYANYQIKLPSNLYIGETMNIFASIVYINRYVNLPASITLSEDQKLQYEDIKFIVSPYTIAKQDSTYKFAKIIQSDKGQKRGASQVVFTQSVTKPFTLVRHTVFGVNNNPQVVFTQVKKTIELSHWGNVAVVENYNIVNTGPTLKGQFSRVTYGSRSGEAAKNAYKGVDFDLPYEIWGLYYLDQVGNITTSKAWRDESSKIVHVHLEPRFALLGGWKSNWELGYNFKTDGHLFQEGSKFSLKNIKIEYGLEKIISQQFNIRLVLPYGAENVAIKIDGKEITKDQIKIEQAEGYLDFNGRPVYVIDNYEGNLKDQYLEVNYEYNPTRVYFKPISLSTILFGFLLLAILAQRFKLEAFEDKDAHLSKAKHV